MLWREEQGKRMRRQGCRGNLWEGLRGRQDIKGVTAGRGQMVQEDHLGDGVKRKLTT